jgi:cytochrome P450
MARMASLAASYGDIVAFSVGRERFYLFNHPEYIQAILVDQASCFCPEEPPASLHLDRLRPPAARQFSQLARQAFAYTADLHAGGESMDRRWFSGCEHLADTVYRTLALLGSHPAHRLAAQQEVDTVLGTDLPGNTSAPCLPFLRRALVETLRLYPPHPLISRRVVQDVVIGGYRMPAGMLALVSPWLIQRDARYYPASLDYNPNRWIDASTNSLPACSNDLSAPSDSRPAFTYFPFGGGARSCPVETLAWTAGVIMVAIELQSQPFN